MTRVNDSTVLERATDATVDATNPQAKNAADVQAAADTLYPVFAGGRDNRRPQLINRLFMDYMKEFVGEVKAEPGKDTDQVFEEAIISMLGKDATDIDTIVTEIGDTLRMIATSVHKLTVDGRRKVTLAGGAAAIDYAKMIVGYRDGRATITNTLVKNVSERVRKVNSAE